jgi:hypothetical protein
MCWHFWANLKSRPKVPSLHLFPFAILPLYPDYTNTISQSEFFVECMSWSASKHWSKQIHWSYNIYESLGFHFFGDRLTFKNVNRKWVLLFLSYYKFQLKDIEIVLRLRENKWFPQDNRTHDSSRHLRENFRQQENISPRQKNKWSRSE